MGIWAFFPSLALVGDARSALSTMVGNNTARWTEDLWNARGQYHVVPLL
jgi:hypothetical protein